jgi:riboflavin synthase
MFTGIVTDIGRVAALEARAGGARLAVNCACDPATIAIGASIACAGVCVTVVAAGAANGGSRFEADLSAETLAVTTLGRLAVGDRLNLERALRAGDELAGHIVQGHVDGVAEIVAREADGDSLRYTVRAPDAFARYIAPKGSLALDGASLTVNEVAGCEFTVNIVPHTRAVTTWGARAAGDRVNLEVDLVARYLARLNDMAGA